MSVRSESRRRTGDEAIVSLSVIGRLVWRHRDGRAVECSRSV